MRLVQLRFNYSLVPVGQLYFSVFSCHWRSPPIGRKELQIPREMINTKNIFRSETAGKLIIFYHRLIILWLVVVDINKHLKLQKQEEIRLYSTDK
jgi:hypothetical protein